MRRLAARRVSGQADIALGDISSFAAGLRKVGRMAGDEPSGVRPLRRLAARRSSGQADIALCDISSFAAGLRKVGRMAGHEPSGVRPLRRLAARRSSGQADIALGDISSLPGEPAQGWVIFWLPNPRRGRWTSIRGLFAALCASEDAIWWQPCEGVSPLRRLAARRVSGQADIALGDISSFAASLRKVG